MCNILQYKANIQFCVKLAISRLSVSNGNPWILQKYQPFKMSKKLSALRIVSTWLLSVLMCDCHSKHLAQLVASFQKACCICIWPVLLMSWAWQRILSKICKCVRCHKCAFNTGPEVDCTESHSILRKICVCVRGIYVYEGKYIYVCERRYVCEKARMNYGSYELHN